MIIGSENALAENVTAAKIAPTPLPKARKLISSAVRPDQEDHQEGQGEHRLVADVALERGTKAACQDRFLAALELGADRIEPDAGQRCEKYETAEHTEHNPLAAAEPRDE
jgi:hypothetical protein